jgi:uncharacterized protein (PEP-CTERM system associated)
MTITTARLARALQLAYGTPLALAALLCTGAARAVDLEGIDLVKPSVNAWRIVPLLDVRQIFTDNVSSQPDERKHSQFLTDIAPGLEVSHKGPRLVVDGKFQFHYYANAHERYGARRSSNRINANAKAELLDDLLFVDASANSFQQGISPFGQLVSDNDYSSANRANVQSWQVSPYLLQRYGRVARSELRYTHDEVKTSSGGLRDSKGDAILLRVSSGSAFRDFGWGLNLSKTHVDYDIRNDSTFQAASLNLSYQLLPTFGLTAAALYDDYDYQSIGGANGGRGGTVGLRWTPSRRTSVQASAGHRYYGPSRALQAQHRSRRSVWNLSYDDAVMTMRGNFLLPGTPTPAPGLPPIVAPAGLGDLFNPDVLPPPVPVPVVLPPSLSENLNFFSNRYSLQKQLRASVAVRGARSGATFSLFKVRRQALSLREDDSEILGTAQNRVNDNVDQLGMNVTLTYRLSQRSNVHLSGDVVDSESLTTGLQGRSNAARLNFRHQLGRNVAASVELRRIKGVVGLTSGVGYTENALSASLNMKL